MTDAQRADIARLLAEGKSQAEVAEKVGLSKSCLGKYALRHGLGRRGPRQKKPRGAKHEGPRRESRSECPGCGYTVPMPCVYCQGVAAAEAKGRGVR